MLVSWSRAGPLVLFLVFFVVLVGTKIYLEKTYGVGDQLSNTSAQEFKDQTVQIHTNPVQTNGPVSAELVDLQVAGKLSALAGICVFSVGYLVKRLLLAADDSNKRSKVIGDLEVDHYNKSWFKTLAAKQDTAPVGRPSKDRGLNLTHTETHDERAPSSPQLTKKLNSDPSPQGERLSNRNSDWWGSALSATKQDPARRAANQTSKTVPAQSVSGLKQEKSSNNSDNKAKAPIQHPQKSSSKGKNPTTPKAPKPKAERPANVVSI